MLWTDPSSPTKIMLLNDRLNASYTPARKLANKQTTVIVLKKMQQQERTKVIQHDICSQPQWVVTTLVHLNEREEIQILLSTPGVMNINLNLFLHDISHDISAGHAVMTYRMIYQHGISALQPALSYVGSTRKIMSSVFKYCLGARGGGANNACVGTGTGTLVWSWQWVTNQTQMRWERICHDLVQCSEIESHTNM